MTKLDTKHAAEKRYQGRQMSGLASREQKDQERARAAYPVSRVCKPIASPDAIDDDALAAFARDGFIAVANVLRPEEVQAYRAAITDAAARDDGSEQWAKIINYEPGFSPEKLAELSVEDRELAVRKLFAFSKVLPDLGAAGKHETLVSICERLTGEGVHMMQDMALLKPPGGGVEKPWHQDMAYFRLSTPDKVIGTWTALDPAHAGNGCMHIIPGSHKAGPTPHYHDRDCQIPDDKVDMDNVVAVELEPGGVLFFSGLVHHGTPPNLSHDRRRALQFHYITDSAVKTEDAEILASLFGDNDGFAGCQGWSLGMKTRPLHLRADF